MGSLMLAVVLLVPVIAHADLSDTYAHGMTAVVPPMYEIIDLGDFGGELSNANSTNDLGDVVGVADDPASIAIPFLWRNGKLTDLGTLRPDPPRGDGVAHGISDNGYAVGYALSAFVGMGSTAHAFFWSAEDGMVDLTPDSGSATVAWSVNSSGQVAGGGEGPGTSPFLWTQEDGITPINLPDAPDGFGGDATGINERGIICGGQINATFRESAWLYDSSTAVLRELESFDGGDTHASSINNRNDVVGWSSRSAGEDHSSQSVFWPGGGNIVEIAGLPVPGYRYGEAVGINDDRWIVGADYVDTPAGTTQAKAWLWIDDHKFELRELINDPVQRAEWDSLDRATDINNRDEIVGTGVRNGILGRGFLMRPLPKERIYADGFEGRKAFGK